MKPEYSTANTQPNPIAWIQGGGKMGELIRTLDWSRTILGPISEWPMLLRFNVNLLLHSPLPMMVLWGPEGIMLYNDGFSAFAGKRHPSVLGAKVLEGWPEVAEHNRRILDAVMQGEMLSFKNAKFTLNRNDGPEEVWLNLNYSPILDELGHSQGALAIIVETTDQVLAEAALRESEERLVLALEATRDGIWDWDFKNDKAWWDERYVEITGMELQEGQRSLESATPYIHPEDRQIVPEALKAHLERGEKFEFEYRILHPSGEIRHVFAQGKAILDQEGNVARLTGTLSDITERKKSEEIARRLTESLRIANKLLSGITEGTSDLIAAIDKNYRYLVFNRAYQTEVNEIFGSQIEVGMSVMETLAHLPQEQSRALETWGRALKGENYRTIEEFGGLKRKYYELSYSPLMTEEGEIIGAFHIVRDTNERKRAELRLQEYKDRLERSNRELEQFATIASHDLRAPLRKIATFSSALEHSDGERLSSEGKDYLQRINNSAEKMQALVDGLLTLSRVTRQAKPFKQVRLKDILIEVIADLGPYRKEVGGKIELGEFCDLEGDEVQLYQLFQNLISNALKFHRKDVSPSIKVDSVIAPSGMCSIAISDNGIGFNVNQADRIFEVFERLHSQKDFEGSGIGLAVVKKIVERHNGSIHVESLPGVGTTFTVLLPLRQSENEDALDIFTNEKAIQ